MAGLRSVLRPARNMAMSHDSEFIRNIHSTSSELMFVSKGGYLQAARVSNHHYTSDILPLYQSLPADCVGLICAKLIGAQLHHLSQVHRPSNICASSTPINQPSKKASTWMYKSFLS